MEDIPLVKIPLPCEVYQVVKILKAMPKGCTMADMETRENELWIWPPERRLTKGGNHK